ncbi:MAG: SDR family NAD(P)-dependent oxidoreductase [Hyphomicrobiales bacterium]
MAVVVITGAIRGIGLALAQHYCARGDEVIACVRQISDELVKTGAEIHEGVDLGEGAAISAFCDGMKERAIDVLISNAGIFNDRGPIEEVDVETVRDELNVNVLGPLQLVRDLLPVIHEGGKIAFITSAMGSLEENETGLYHGYRFSKVSINMLAKSLSNELWDRMIATVAVHPGYVKT